MSHNEYIYQNDIILFSQLKVAMFSKIAIRNIPSAIFKALETLADSHNRSTEGEARQALMAWVEPLLVNESRNTRRQSVAKRLNHMLEQINAGCQGARLTTSQLAEAIKEERAEEVEDWFLGNKEPSFFQLSAIAKQLGVEPDWLKHGDKALFPMHYKRLAENPHDAVAWLLTWLPIACAPQDQVKNLHLIRADDPTGQLYIVKESNEGHFQTFHTPIHISEEIGAGGEASLAALFVTLELLYKGYTKSGSDMMVLGYLLHADDIEQLRKGNTHPGSLLTDKARSMWWEDIWDSKMAPKHDYWPGWESLHGRIQRVILARPQLNELRTKIRQGADFSITHSDILGNAVIASFANS
jgi:antitoxin FitA